MWTGAALGLFAADLPYLVVDVSLLNPAVHKLTDRPQWNGIVAPAGHTGQFVATFAPVEVWGPLSAQKILGIVPRCREGFKAGLPFRV